MLTALAVITATVFGTLAGVEFSVAAFINPMLHRLPAEARFAGQSYSARVLGRLMPFWYIASLLLTAGLAAALWGGHGAGPAVAAAALQVVNAIMSVALLVPIASRSATWTAQDHPEDWREQSRRWERLHWARVAIILAALVLTLVAVAA